MRLNRTLRGLALGSVLMFGCGPGAGDDPTDSAAVTELASLTAVPDPTINSFTVTPSIGTKANTFAVNWTTTNATTCSLTKDGPVVSTNCNGTYTVPSGQSFDSHTLRLSVTGNQQTVTADRIFTVRPTCFISVSPLLGSLAAKTAFKLTYESDAPSCTWTLDGVNKGAIVCSNTFNFNAVDLGVGDHYLSLKGTVSSSLSRTCTALVRISN